MAADAKVAAISPILSVARQTAEQSGSATAKSVDLAFVDFSARHLNRPPRAVGRAQQHSAPPKCRHDLLWNQQFEAVDEQANFDLFDKKSNDKAPQRINIDELFSLLSLQ
jgi:hypothetical protein